jgi:hypothetical protein
MENTPKTTAPKRTRRSAAQWHAILTEHLSTGAPLQELAERLGCAVSTIELQMRRMTSPDGPPAPKPAVAPFVEVSARVAGPAEGGDVLRLHTAAGVTASFSVLPPPEYLAAALGLST